MGLLLTSLLSASFSKEVHIVNGLPSRCHIYTDTFIYPLTCKIVGYFESCRFYIYCNGRRRPLTGGEMLPAHFRTLKLSMGFSSFQKDPKLTISTAKSAKEKQEYPRSKAHILFSVQLVLIPPHPSNGV